MLAFTGHKSLLGPTGTGGLYIGPKVNLKPLKTGGTGADSQAESHPLYLPDRLEAGTLNTAGIAGLAAGARFLLDTGIASIRVREQRMTDILIKEMERIPGVIIYGPGTASERVAMISFNVAGVNPAEVAYVLDEVYGIMVSAGLHCAHRAHHAIGTENSGTVRVSLGWSTTEDDIVTFCRALSEIARAAS